MEDLALVGDLGESEGDEVKRVKGMAAGGGTRGLVGGAVDGAGVGIVRHAVERDRIVGAIAGQTPVGRGVVLVDAYRVRWPTHRWVLWADG